MYSIRRDIIELEGLCCFLVEMVTRKSNCFSYHENTSPTPGGVLLSSSFSLFIITIAVNLKEKHEMVPRRSCPVEVNQAGVQIKS